MRIPQSKIYLHKIVNYIHGNGIFKDPQAKIWELADLLVSSAFIEGLRGIPIELKMKYLANNYFADLKGDELKEAISKSIGQKEKH